MCQNTFQGHRCDGIEGHQHKMHWSVEANLEWPAHLPVISEEKRLREIDRTARAYGWEVGRLENPYTPVDKVELSPGNPFIDPNWRENVR